MARFSDLFGGIAVGFKTARYSHVLNQLSDRQLAGMGLHRRDIPRRALELAEGR